MSNINAFSRKALQLMVSVQPNILRNKAENYLPLNCVEPLKGIPGELFKAQHYFYPPSYQSYIPYLSVIINAPHKRKVFEPKTPLS